MRIPCEIITDLLPLYIDGVCGEETKGYVKEHLETCDSCSQKYRYMTADVAEPPMSLTEDEKRIKRGIRRLRHRWALALAAALLVLPLLLLSVNQFRGEGIAFTNIDDFVKSYRVCLMLQNGEYGRFFDMWEDGRQSSWRGTAADAESWLDTADQKDEASAAFKAKVDKYLEMGYEAGRADARERFISQMEQLEEEHGAVRRVGFHNCYAVSGGWHMEFDLYFEGEERSYGGVIFSSGWGFLDIGGSYRDSDVGADKCIDAFIPIFFRANTAMYELSDETKGL